jgi:hypothetical protein
MDAALWVFGPELLGPPLTYAHAGNSMEETGFLMLVENA